MGKRFEEVADKIRQAAFMNASGKGTNPDARLFLHIVHGLMMHLEWPTDKWRIRTERQGEHVYFWRERTSGMGLNLEIDFQGQTFDAPISIKTSDMEKWRINMYSEFLLDFVMPPSEECLCEFYRKAENAIVANIALKLAEKMPSPAP